MSAIVPKTETTTRVVVRFSLDIIELIVNTSATFRVNTYNIKDALIDSQFVILAGAAYSNWGNNDEYVVQYVANELGFTLVP